MSVTSDLAAALGPLVANRAYPNTLPQDVAWPCIRFQTTSSVPGVSICGDSGDDSAEVRVQLDLIARTYAETQTLRTSTLAAMAALSTPAVLELQFEEYDSEAKGHRIVLQYSLHPSSDGAT